MMAGIAFTLVMLMMVPLKPIWKPKLLALFEDAGSGPGVGECDPAQA